jgi:hypothetical protein
MQAIGSYFFFSGMKIGANLGMVQTRGSYVNYRPARRSAAKNHLALMWAGLGRTA